MKTFKIKISVKDVNGRYKLLKTKKVRLNK